jgi:hypothetical protein
MRHALAVLALASAPVVSCGSDPCSGDCPNPNLVFVTLDPVSVSIMPGDSALFTVHLDREGKTADLPVTLSAFGLPKGLAVAFASPTTTDTSVAATVSASADASLGITASRTDTRTDRSRP